jgi:hypothetical protein
MQHVKPVDALHGEASAPGANSALKCPGIDPSAGLKLLRRHAITPMPVKRQASSQKCYMPQNTTLARNFILFAVAVKLKALIE